MFVMFSCSSLMHHYLSSGKIRSGFIEEFGPFLEAIHPPRQEFIVFGIPSGLRSTVSCSITSTFSWWSVGDVLRRSRLLTADHQINRVTLPRLEGGLLGFPRPDHLSYPR